MPETTKTCQVRMQDDKPCGRDVYENGCCLFHSRMKDKEVKLFQQEFDHMLENPPLGSYDFTRFVFPKGVSFPKNLQRSAIFVRAVFSGDADFDGTVFQGNAEFGWAVFKGKASFAKTTFKGDARFLETQFMGGSHFGGSTFQGRSSFAAATFYGKGEFTGCSFEGVANFHCANFEKDSNFTRATFQARAEFWEAEFKDESHFDQATFKREAKFCEAGFTGGCRFDFARFENEADFEGGRFERHAHFEGVRFVGEAKFWPKRFRESACFGDAVFHDALLMRSGTRTRGGLTGNVDFRRVKLLNPRKVEFEKVDLSRFRFIETDLRGVHFTDVEWRREKGKGRHKVFDEVSPDPYFEEFDYALIRQLYRRLRANYEDNLQYAEAGDFYIGEMEMTRKAERNVIKKFPLLFYEAISNYGESYYRPLCWIAAILLIFPLVFMFFGIQPVSLDPSNPAEDVISYRLDLSSTESFAPTWEKVGDYYTCFLYSISVFSFIRDKKYTTVDNWGHTLFVVESILSPITLAFFLLALRRRFKR